MPQFEVTISRRLSTTVHVNAPTAEDAAGKVMDLSFPLPPVEQWDGCKDWQVQVRTNEGRLVYQDD